MIELIVKTLDSQNHNFTVEDGITVKEFKDHIATAVGITADNQRLIYCGRVLQDQKKLSEYDVSGKVIHLVQRPPPSAGSPSTASSNDSPNTTPSFARRTGRFVQVRQMAQPSGTTQDGSGLLLGAFTVPSNVVDHNHVQEIIQQVVTGMGELGRNATIMSRTSDDGSTVDVHINLTQPPARSETNQRLLSARDMIRRAGECITRLQNARRDEEDQVRDEVVDPSGTLESDRIESNLVVDVDEFNIEISESIPFDESSGAGLTVAGMADAARVAAAAVFAAAESSVTVDTSPTNEATSTTTTTPVTAPSAPSLASDVRVEPEGSSGESIPNQNASSTSSFSDTAASVNSSSSQSQQPPAALTRATILADVLDEISAFHTRFGPFLDELRATIREDPVFQPSQRAQRLAAQNTFHNVSRVLHLLSHAYHVVSDVVLDFSQPPPRMLHSQVVVVQQPTLVQAAIPIQAQINISTTLSATTRSTPTTTVNSNSNNNNGTEATTTNAVPTVAPNTNASVSPATTSQFTHSVRIPLGTNPMAGHFGSANPFVIMQVMPSNVTIEGVVANGSPSTTNPQAPRNPLPCGRFAQGQNQDFLRNLMQAVTQGPSGQRTAGNGAANGNQSQARGNTATQPTTSTQTRSTSRPVQAIQQIPGFSLPAFDPFLPCTSRHVYNGRSSVRRSAAAHPSADAATQPSTQNDQSGSVTVDANTAASNPLAGFVSNILSSLFVRNGDQTTAPQVGSNGGTPISTPQQPTVIGTTQAQPITQEAVLSAFLNNFRSAQAQTQPTPSAPPVTASSSSSTSPASQRPSETMFEFFRTFAGFNESVTGENLINDLLVCVARHMTILEFILVCRGRPAPLDQLRTPLSNFISSNLRGERGADYEIVDGDIHNAIRNILADINRALPDTMGGILIREGVDYLATLRRFCSVWLEKFIRFILSAPGDNFGTNLYNICHEFISLAVRLHLYCFNGADGLERMISNLVVQSGSDLNPAFQGYVLGFSSSHVQSMVSNLTNTDDDVQEYIVRTTSVTTTPTTMMMTSTATMTTTTPTVIGNSTPVIVENRVAPLISTGTEEQIIITQRPSLIINETMDVTPSGPILVPGVMGAAARAFVNPADNLMEAEEAISEAVWQSTVPTEWVPIITEDVHRQRRAGVQRPFSDGYIASMPSKRRKMIGENRVQVDASLLPDVLTRAVASAGVRPTTSIESVAEEVASSPSLQSAFRNHLNGRIRQRLSDDHDYEPGKFPATDLVFGGNKGSKQGKDF